jgi:hypothetical protein
MERPAKHIRTAPGGFMPSLGAVLLFITLFAGISAAQIKYVSAMDRVGGAGSDRIVSVGNAKDYLSLKKAGEGEARLGFGYGIDRLVKDVSDVQLSVGARIGIIKGLEAGLSLPIPVSASYEVTQINGDKKTECAEGYAGISLPQLMFRYWLVDIGLGIYTELTLPVDTRYDKNADGKKYWRRGLEPSLELGLGVQYSTAFTKAFYLGSQFGLIMPAEKSDVIYMDGMSLYLGAELDYVVKIVTLFLGFDLDIQITPAQYEGKDIKYDKDNDRAPSETGIWYGNAFKFSDRISADVSLKFQISDKYKYMYYDSKNPFKAPEKKNYSPVIIGAHVFFNL